MGAGFIVPLLGAAASLGGQIWGQNKTARENRAIAERQFKHDKEMLAYQLEYNNPENQMKRLKAAGLNPNLVYGSGGVTGNISSELPKYREEGTDYSLDMNDASRMVTDYFSTQVKLKSIEKLDADIDATKAKTANDVVKNDILATENLRQAEEFENYKELYPYQYEMKKQLAEKSTYDAQNALKSGQMMDSELKTKVLQRGLIAQEIQGAKIDNKTKQQLLDDLKKGVAPNSPFFMRLMLRISEKLQMDKEELMKAWETKMEEQKNGKRPALETIYESLNARKERLGKK